MSTRTTNVSRRSIEFLVACCAVMGLLFVSGCSSDSAKSSDSTTVADKSGDDTGKSGDEGGVPDGFPDIPLPEFTKADVIKSGAGKSPGWSVMFTVDPTLKTGKDEILTAYVEQLEAAGYEIEGDTTEPSISATKDGTDIHFHSSMDGTITIAVFEP